MTSLPTRLACAFATALGSACLPACAEAHTPDPEPYLRVQEQEETGGVSLQIALRTFQRGPNEPTLTLVGVAHVGTPDYYRELEERLDAHDLVLFEGVGPLWAALGDDASEQDKIAATRSRIRMVAVSAMQQRAKGASVRTIEDTYAGVPGYEARLIRASGIDAWGRPLEFEAPDDGSGFVIVSLGADGEPPPRRRERLAAVRRGRLVHDRGPLAADEHGLRAGRARRIERDATPRGRRAGPHHGALLCALPREHRPPGQMLRGGR